MKQEINLHDFEAMIFDFDGTLVDSLGLWHRIDVFYLSQFGLECPEDLAESINGMSITETAQYFKDRFSIPDSIEKIIQDWVVLSHNYYMTTIPFKKDAKEFLQMLNKNNFKLGIATSNHQNTTENFFEKENIDFINTYSYSADCPQGKPAPYVFLNAANNLGVDPSACLAFEDTVEGVTAAKSAGMTVVGVADQYSKKNEEKIKELADYFIEDYSQLM